MSTSSVLQLLGRVLAWLGATYMVWCIAKAALIANTGFNGSWASVMPVFVYHLRLATAGLAVWAFGVLMIRKWGD
jgi:hypothetical protein